jgi:hypothetical protein
MGYGLKQAMTAKRSVEKRIISAHPDRSQTLLSQIFETEKFNEGAATPHLTNAAMNILSIDPVAAADPRVQGVYFPTSVRSPRHYRSIVSAIE